MRLKLYETDVKIIRWSDIRIERCYTMNRLVKSYPPFTKYSFPTHTTVLKGLVSCAAQFISLSGHHSNAFNDASYLCAAIPTLCTYMRVCTSYVKGLNGLHFKILEETFVVVLNIEQGNKNERGGGVIFAVRTVSSSDPF